MVRALAAVLLLSTTLMAGQAPILSVSAAARSIQPGEVVRVTIDTAMPMTTMQLSAFGVAFLPYRVTETRWQALVGIDLDVKPGRHTVTIIAADGTHTATTTRTLVVAAKAFPTRRLTVDAKYVEPPAEVTARIVAEAERLNAIWALRTADGTGTAAFTAPVPDAANSAFGSRSVFNGQPRSPHGGADFASPAGRPIKAPAAGRVVLAEDLYFTGGSVVIDHGLGLVSLFAHLSSIDVTTGVQVGPGDVIGQVGRTGRVTGPHLHWTVRLAGTRVDPLSLIAATQLADTAVSSGLLP
jgi:murein DD-endopeptidase MepM/ murein hydrolase activator NlpD